jgi:hypothetical protein
LLQLLIGVVDAQLLKAIMLKNLETRDIQNTNERRRIAATKNLVDTTHDPQENTTVERLDKSVTRVGGLLHVQVRWDQLVSGLDTRLDDGIRELGGRDRQQLGSVLQRVLGTGDLGTVTGTGDELHIAQVQDGGENTVDGGLLPVIDTARGHGGTSVRKLLGIADAVDGVAAALVQVLVLLGTTKVQSSALGGRDAGEQLVEDVEVAFAGRLADDTRLFKQVALHTGTSNRALVVELEADELAETRRVIVSNSLGITKGFEHRIQFEQLLLQLTLTMSTTGNGHNVLNDLFGVFSLTSTRLATMS